MTLIDLELEALHPSQKAHYEKCVANGCTPPLALMLATRHAPEMGESDRTFAIEQHENMRTMDPLHRDRILAIAKRAGINTHGKTYHGQLGKYHDPLAWVADTSDAKQALKRKNMRAEGGLVNNKDAVDLPPPPPPPLAEDIKRRLMRDRLAELQQLQGPPVSTAAAKKRLHEAEDYVVALHGPTKATRRTPLRRTSDG